VFFFFQKIQVEIRSLSFSLLKWICHVIRVHTSLHPETFPSPIIIMSHPVNAIQCKGKAFERKKAGSIGLKTPIPAAQKGKLYAWKHRQRRGQDSSRANRLVDLLDSRAIIGVATWSTAGSTTREAAAGHASRHATLAASTIELHHDGVGDRLELLLL